MSGDLAGLRLNYRLIQLSLMAWIAFFGVLFFYCFAYLQMVFTRNPRLLELLNDDQFNLYLVATFLGIKLIAAGLLLTRWTNRGWALGSGFLFVLVLFDVVLSFLINSSRLGLDTLNQEYFSMTYHLYHACHWPIYWLVAVLAHQMAMHVSVEPTGQIWSVGQALPEQSVQFGFEDREVERLGFKYLLGQQRMTRSPGEGAASLGLIFWTIHILFSTNWRGGWPLQIQPDLTATILHCLLQGITAILVISSCLMGWIRIQKILGSLNQDQEGRNALPSVLAFQDQGWVVDEAKTEAMLADLQRRDDPF